MARSLRSEKPELTRPAALADLHRWVGERIADLRTEIASADMERRNQAIEDLRGTLSAYAERAGWLMAEIGRHETADLLFGDFEVPAPAPVKASACRGPA